MYLPALQPAIDPNTVMLLHLSTWLEVEAYLKQSKGVIIPIGSSEQHGPTGLIGTDHICAEAIAHGISKEIHALVSSTLNVGMAEHHTGFPGTISFKPSTLMLVIRDYITSLAKHGFQRFFFINGHGGNIAVLKSAFSEIYSDYPEIRCHVANWWASGSVYSLAKQLYGEQEGSHATPSEVAVTMYVYPEVVKSAHLQEKVNRGNKIYSAQDFRRRYPDGRMGSNPALATPDHGRQFYELAVKDLGRQYLEFLQEE